MEESYFGAYRYNSHMMILPDFASHLEYEKERLKEKLGAHIVSVLLRNKKVFPVVTEQTIRRDGIVSFGLWDIFYEEYQIRVDFKEMEKK